MKPKLPMLTRIAIGTTVILLSMLYPFAGFAQSRSDASADRARQARIAELKAKIANLQDQLNKTEAEEQSAKSGTHHAAANNSGGCCEGKQPGETHASHHPGGSLAQAGGGGMGGGMEGEMGGGGMGGTSASPAASPAMKAVRLLLHLRAREQWENT
jgi:hypothetical protein